MQDMCMCMCVCCAEGKHAGHGHAKEPHQLGKENIRICRRVITKMMRSMPALVWSARGQWGSRRVVRRGQRGPGKCSEHMRCYCGAGCRDVIIIIIIKRRSGINPIPPTVKDRD